MNAPAEITTTKLHYAEALAQNGFHVFPVLPWPLGDEGSKGKTPAVPFKEWATRDVSKIQAHWRANPAHNIGIYTGRFADSKALAGIDVDVKKGKRGDQTMLQLELDGCAFPPTFTQATPTGGRHLLYVVDQPVRQGTDTLGEGIDVRGDGGYLVAVGSTIDGKAYDIVNDCEPAPAPQWLVDRLGKPRERKPADSQDFAGIDAEAAAKRVVHYLTNEAPIATQGAGGDHVTFTVACHAKDLGVDAAACLDLMLQHWNDRCAPPWTPEDLETKVDNAYRYGTEQPGAAAPEKEFPVVEAPVAAAKRKKSTFVSITDALAAIQPIDWLVEGWVESQGLGMLWGESETWKSFLTVSWALCVATGTEWHGHKVKQGPVIYFCGEGQRGIARRAAAWAHHNGVELEEIPLLISRCSTNVRKQEVINAVSEAVAVFGRNPSLIVVDTLHRNFGGGNENDSQDVGTMLEVLDRHIAQPLQCAVMLVHHANKGGESFRGSSSLRNSMDFEYSTLRAGDTVTLTPEKMKEAEKPESITFAAQQVVLEFGHGVDSSLVLEPTAARGPVRKPKTLRATVADVLMAMQPGPDGWIDVKDMRQAIVVECATRGAVEPSRQNINRELGRLEDNGWLTRGTGKVRINPLQPDNGSVVTGVVTA